jgi:AcrR family transcriptional regulator
MKNRRGEITRESLVRHGLKFASDRGLAGVSIAPIAAQAGITKSSFFTHFPTKESLQIALLDAAGYLFRDAVLLSASRAGAGLDRLRRLFESWLGWTERVGLTGDIFVAATNELDDMDGAVRDRLVSLQEFWIQGLAGFIQDAIDTGDLAEQTDVKQLAFELAGIYLAHQSTKRLMRDGSADNRALAAFDRLVATPPLRSRRAGARPSSSASRRASNRNTKNNR